MSLVVWMPLLGTLDNQGLDGSAFTNYGATVDNSGKIGKCYAFTNTAITAHPDVSQFSNNFSFCCWVYFANTNSAQYIFHLGSKGTWVSKYSILQDYGGTIVYHIHGVECKTSISISSYLNTWMHLALTYDGATAKIYINGSQVLSESKSQQSFTAGNNLAIGSRINNSSATSFAYGLQSGKLNDVRLYNRTLSPKEVKEISKGLMVHYPLTRGGRGQANLYDFETIATKWTNEGMTSLSTYSDATYGNVLKFTNTSANVRIYRSVSNVWTTATTYTVSFMARSATAGTVINMSRSIADFTPNFTLTTDWKYYSGSLTVTSTSTGGTLSVRTVSGTGEVYLANVKLEIGSVATSYMPGVGDSHYNAIGYNDTVEYDTSGNLYNATVNGTVNMVSDSPRYSACSYFDADANYLSRTAITAPAYTASFWVKYRSDFSAYRVVFADQTSHLAFGMINSTTACCTCAGKQIKTFSTSAVTANAWHHIAIVRNTDLSDAELYVDGVKITGRGNNDAWNHTTDTLLIGRRSSGSSPIAYVSDFRLYATQLSQEDILQLYNTSASIANNGVLMSYEFAET